MRKVRKPHHLPDMVCIMVVPPLMLGFMVIPFCFVLSKDKKASLVSGYMAFL
jgi:hypothetical protein